MMRGDLRRIVAETLIGWAIQLYPVETPVDGAVFRALLLAITHARGGLSEAGRTR